MSKTCLFSIILLLLSSIVYSRSTSGQRERFDHIENLISENPDSAIVLLYAIDTNFLENKEDKARYALLLTEARYKSGMDETDDSLINRSVEYYKDKYDNPYRAKAYYYAGIICVNGIRYGDAVLNFLKSEKTAKVAGDSVLLGLVYRGLGGVFEDMRDMQTSITYYKKALDIFESSGNAKYGPYAYLDLCRAYRNSTDYKKSSGLADIGYRIADSIGNVSLLSHFIRMKGNNLISEGKFREARREFDKLDSLGASAYYVPRDWMQKGILCIEEGDIRGAEVCNDSLKSHIPDEEWLSARIYMAKKDYKRASEIQSSEISIQNDYIKGILNMDFTNTLSDYYALQERDAEMRLAAERKEKLYLLSFGLLLLTLIGIIYYHRGKVYRTKVDNIMSIGEELKNILGDKQSVIDVMAIEKANREDELAKLRHELDDVNRTSKEDIHSLLSSRFNMLDSFCNLYYEYGATKKDKEHIYEKVISTIKSISDDDVIAEFENEVDSKMDRLITRFKNDNPKLTPPERKMFLFMVYGFSNKAISVLQNVKVEVIYNRRSMLKKKIAEHCISDAKEEYLQYFG